MKILTTVRKTDGEVVSLILPTVPKKSERKLVLSKTSRRFIQLCCLKVENEAFGN
jgi:hypothetical protein